MSNKEFKINEYIILKLENGITRIYIEGMKFRTCKYLLINIPKEKVSEYDNFDSIDEIKECLSSDLEINSQFQIDPIDEFHGHCSNLQAWAENDYDTRILEMKLAFPLLKRLAEVGDPKAKKVFNEEIDRRINSALDRGYMNIIHYLLEEHYFEIVELSKKTLENIIKKVSNSRLKMQLAHNPNTPKALLREFSTSPNITLKKLVAENPNTPKEILKNLGEKETKVKIHLTRNPNISLSLLDKLSKDNNKWVRNSIAKNPTIPSKILENLVDDSYRDVRENLAKNPNSTIKILKTLSRKGSTIKSIIAQDPTTPPEVLRILADRETEIRECVALNKNAPRDVLEELARSDDKILINYVASNPNTPIKTLRKLAKESPFLTGLANNPNTPTDLLKKFANSPIINTYRKELIAGNPNTSPDLLKKFAQDDNLVVKKMVAGNPSTPKEILTKFGKYGVNRVPESEIFENAYEVRTAEMNEIVQRNIEIKECVAGNPSTPSETLERLGQKGEFWAIRSKVAGNPTTPKNILIQMAKSEINVVRRSVGENPNAPSKALRRLSHDQEPFIVESVAGNPSTPKKTLKRLSKSQDIMIRRSALTNLQS